MKVFPLNSPTKMLRFWMRLERELDLELKIVAGFRRDSDTAAAAGRPY
jgi:hypothetical protein